MKTLMALVAALALVATAAKADVITGSCSNGACRTIISPDMQPGAIARIIQVPQGFDEVDDRQWTDYCKPVIKKDSFGVRRYTYAERGCEYGRDE